MPNSFIKGFLIKCRHTLDKVLAVSDLEVNQTGKDSSGSGVRLGVPTTSVLHLIYVSLHTLRFRSIDFLSAHLHHVFGKMIHLSHHNIKQIIHTHLFQSDTVISYPKLKLWCKIISRPCSTTSILINYSCPSVTTVIVKEDISFTFFSC